MNDKQNKLNFYYHKKIEWMPGALEGEDCVYPVNGFNERPPFNEGGFDWFGCKWEYMEAAGAPAPDVSYQALDDICDWREKVQFPDLENWDWEKAVELDKVADADRENHLYDVVVCDGLWERLNTLMGFEDALCALLEEPEEVDAFFDAMVQHKITLIDKLSIYYKPDAITFHDDWGTQKGPFFSPEYWREHIKPRQKEIIDFAHSKNICFIQHSCGKYDDIIPDIAEIGVDTLQCMDINDIGRALQETGDSMSYYPSVHTQKYNALNEAGKLTEDMVREEVSREFNEWGATGHYAPFVFPPSVWYEEIVMDEYVKARDALKGTY